MRSLALYATVSRHATAIAHLQRLRFPRRPGAMKATVPTESARKHEVIVLLEPDVLIEGGTRRGEGEVMASCMTKQDQPKRKDRIQMIIRSDPSHHARGCATHARFGEAATCAIEKHNEGISVFGEVAEPSKEELRSLACAVLALKAEATALSEIGY